MGIFRVTRDRGGFSLFFMKWKILSCHKKLFSKRYEQLRKKRFNHDFSFADKVEMVSERFEKITGYPLNLKHPRTFNEKLQWLKLYHSDPLMTVCADKYKVKSYLSGIIDPAHVVPTLHSWSDPDEIDFSILPNEFVLKVNWGSGQNIIVRDKATVNATKIRKILRKWINPKANHYYHSFEPSYKDIEARIICEPYIGELSQNLTCYKVFTFSGKPHLIQAVFDDKTVSETINYYDLAWNLLPFRQNFPNNPHPAPKPATLETMIILAEKLAQPFPHFVRVDFFEVNGKTIFSEFTFFSDNGMAPFTPAHWDEKLGDLINLPTGAHCR